MFIPWIQKVHFWKSIIFLKKLKLKLHAKDIYYHFITEKHRNKLYVKHRKMVKEKLI